MFLLFLGKFPGKQNLRCMKFHLSYLFIFKDFVYLLLERGKEEERERERNINVWLPLVNPLLRTWPETQACAPTGN